MKFDYVLVNEEEQESCEILVLEVDPADKTPTASPITSGKVVFLIYFLYIKITTQFSLYIIKNTTYVLFVGFTKSKRSASSKGLLFHKCFPFSLL